MHWEDQFYLRMSRHCNDLENCLLQNNFNPELFIIELVKSYPFRMKFNDFEKKSTDV